MVQGCGYLRPVLDNRSLRKLLAEAVSVLKPMCKAGQFDAIAVTGNSGVLFGSPLALRMNVPLILVRKPDDNAHSLHRVEGEVGAKRYLFVDDLVDSGATLRRTLAALHTEAPHAKFAGVYLYAPDERARLFRTVAALRERGYWSGPSEDEWKLYTE